MATAQFLPSPLVPPVLATLQRLQLWTRAGRFTVDDTGRLAAEVATPALDDSVEALAEWTVAQATLMLQVAMRHLSS
jgi:flagellar basal body rod protein FlgG